MQPPLQVLKAYQHVADYWAERTAAARAGPSGRSIRAKGGREANLPEISDEAAAELERILADALSRTTFSADTTDRDVLKSLLREMPTSQVCMHAVRGVLKVPFCARCQPRRCRALT